MANTKSAVKTIRKIERQTKVNQGRLSKIRTFVKKVETAIQSGNQETAKVALGAAESEIMRGVNHNLFHGNFAARKVSRLSARVKAMV